MTLPLTQIPVPVATDAVSHTPGPWDFEKLDIYSASGGFGNCSMKISYEKTFQGAWRLTAIVGDNFITRQYFGYTKREATRLFKTEAKGES